MRSLCDGGKCRSTYTLPTASPERALHERDAALPALADLRRAGQRAAVEVEVRLDELVGQVRRPRRHDVVRRPRLPVGERDLAPQRRDALGERRLADDEPVERAGGRAQRLGPRAPVEARCALGQLRPASARCRSARRRGPSRRPSGATRGASRARRRAPPGPPGRRRRRRRRRVPPGAACARRAAGTSHARPRAAPRGSTPRPAVRARPAPGARRTCRGPWRRCRRTGRPATRRPCAAACRAPSCSSAGVVGAVDEREVLAQRLDARGRHRVGVHEARVQRADLRLDAVGAPSSAAAAASVMMSSTWRSASSYSARKGPSIARSGGIT